MKVPRIMLGIGLGMGLGAILGDIGLAQKATAKSHSLLVRSSTPGVAITKDGLLFGNAGAAVDIEPGPHRLLLSGDGVVPRMIPVLIPDRPTAYVIDVSFRSAQTGSASPSFPSPETWQDSFPLVRLPSFCKAASKVPRKLRGKFAMVICNRVNLAADVGFLERELFPFFPGQRRLPAQVQELIAKRDNKGSDDYYWEAERLVARLPASPEANQLLVYSAASRGDCLRILELAAEWGAAGKVPAWLRLFEGYCVMMQSGRTTTLQAAATAAGDGSVIAFLTAASLGIKGGKTTAKLLQTCLKKNPLFFPCAQLLALYNLQRGDRRSANRAVGKFRSAAKSYLEQVDLSEIGMASKDPTARRKDPLDRAVAKSPFQFEVVAARLIRDYQREKAPSPQWQERLEETVAVDLKKARAMVKTLERYKDPKTLMACYRVLTQAYPEEAFYWVKLATATRQQGNSSQALENLRQAYSFVVKAEDRAILRFTEGELLVALDRYPEAEKVFTRLSERQAGNWKVFYNLGAIQERLGKNDTAVGNFKKALGLNLPVKYRINIEQRLKTLPK